MNKITADEARMLVLGSAMPDSLSDSSIFLEKEKVKIFSYIQYQASLGNSYIIYKNNFPDIESNMVVEFTNLGYTVTQIDSHVYVVSWQSI